MTLDLYAMRITGKPVKTSEQFYAKRILYMMMWSIFEYPFEYSNTSIDIRKIEYSNIRLNTRIFEY